MKKILLTSLLAVAAVASFAQGSISIGNGVSAAVRFPIYGPQVGSEGVQTVGQSSLSGPTGSTVYTGGLLSGTRYIIEFWAGPASAVDFSGLSLITTTTFRTGANGAALPNGITTSIAGIINGVVPGDSAKLAVRVWDSVGATGYADAGVKGSGALFLSAPLGGNPPGGGTPITPPAWNGVSFSLTAIPEPSSMALAGLGAASLLIFRRRK